MARFAEKRSRRGEGKPRARRNKELEKLKKNADFDIEKEDFLVNYIEELKTFEEYLEQDASDE